MTRLCIMISTVLLLLPSTGESGGLPSISVKTVKPSIVKIYPHDPSAFTQGLLWREGRLYESTGLYGQSSIRILDTVGTILKSRKVPGAFAEGCAFFEDVLYQLTWREQVCILYDPSLRVAGNLPYTGEGWGLTSDSSHLIMSNGSDTLYFRNPDMSIVRKVAVKKDGVPVKDLNELEYVTGKVLANVWHSDFIFEISPSDGQVTKLIDCRELVAIENPTSEESVLNGIAFVKSSGLFYITGKNWKKLFLVKIP
jgi:glutamine cyclotransferase